MPVEGVGTLELAISVTARIVEEGEERSVEIAVDNAKVVREEVMEELPAEVPEPTASDTVEDIPAPEAEPEAEEDAAPVPLDFPGVSLEEEKIIFDDDVTSEPDSGTGSTSETGSPQYDPTAEPIDLFADNDGEPEPDPEEPAPKKKGLFGRFGKKKDS